MNLLSPDEITKQASNKNHTAKFMPCYEILPGPNKPTNDEVLLISTLIRQLQATPIESPIPHQRLHNDGLRQGLRGRNSASLIAFS